MVTIEHVKCTGCGTCTRICHEHCMTVRSGTICIDHGSCSTCTQCIAVCPEQALSWDGIPSSAFDPARLPSSDQLDELLKQRRTIRHFTTRQVPHTVLEGLAAYAAYAPTHSHDFRLVIMDDKGIMDLMDRALTRYTRRIYGLLFKPRLIYAVMRLFAPSMEGEYMRARTKLESGVKHNSILRSRPSAFIAVIGGKRTPLNLESAQYIVYNLTLMAQTMGLGCRNMVGNQSILNHNHAFREVIGLKKGDRVFGLIGVGYPSVNYRNKVEGRRVLVQWNGTRETNQQAAKPISTDT
jgi:nitroreductase/NAD-dependent dihydropyrimidine dehydrogenase PreA subunit